MKNYMTFVEWLEAYMGITWEYFDNNYNNTYDVYKSYNEYLREHGATEGYFVLEEDEISASDLGTLEFTKEFHDFPDAEDEGEA